MENNLSKPKNIVNTSLNNIEKFYKIHKSSLQIAVASVVSAIAMERKEWLIGLVVAGVFGVIEYSQNKERKKLEKLIQNQKKMREEIDEKLKSLKK